jgi:hypothetical protein
MIKPSVSAIMYLDCDTVKYPLALLWRRSMLVVREHPAPNDY